MFIYFVDVMFQVCCFLFFLWSPLQLRLNKIVQPHQITAVQAPPVQVMMLSPGVPVPGAPLLHNQMSPGILNQQNLAQKQGHLFPMALLETE